MLMLSQMYCLPIFKYPQVMQMAMLPAMMEERQPMQEDMQILLLEGIAGVFLIYFSISSVNSSVKYAQFIIIIVLSSAH